MILAPHEKNYMTGRSPSSDHLEVRDETLRYFRPYGTGPHFHKLFPPEDTEEKRFDMFKSHTWLIWRLS